MWPGCFHPGIASDFALGVGRGGLGVDVDETFRPVPAATACGVYLAAAISHRTTLSTGDSGRPWAELLTYPVKILGFFTPGPAVGGVVHFAILDYGLG
jgi:hypothetical protein